MCRRTDNSFVRFLALLSGDSGQGLRRSEIEYDGDHRVGGRRSGWHNHHLHRRRRHRLRSTGNSLQNKAGYKATQVACGRAGAVCEVIRAFGQEPCVAKDRISAEKVKLDGPTNGPT